MHDVIVAGGGPVGAVLALALREKGLDVAVIEPSTRSSEVFRPVVLSHASRLILERLGAFDSSLATPIHSIHVSQQGFGRTVMQSTDLALPALGYVFELASLSNQLRSRAAEHHVPGRLMTWHAHREEIRLSVAAGTKVREMEARLLVIADGGQFAGDDLALRDYAQAAVVALVRTEQRAQNRAWERFTPQGPLALLPYGDHHALVWTVEKQEATALLCLSERDFLHRLEKTFGKRLGNFMEVRNRAGAALQLRFRRDPLAGPRALIVGNAAQTLHPVAGQGLNLGLRDAFELAELVQQTPHALLGTGEFMSAYHRRRQNDRYASIGITDMLVRVFSNNDTFLRSVRGLGLSLLDVLPPARRFFARRMIFGLRGLP